MKVKARRIRFSLLLGVALLATAPAVALTHLGGAPTSEVPAVRVYDASDPASPVLRDATEALAGTGAYATSHDGLFVAAGSEVRRYDRRDLGLPASAAWNAAGPVLGLADGPERGLILVLDASGLTLVRFPHSGDPSAVWTMPLDLSATPTDPGRVVVRSGDRAFVADPSIPGLRVVTVDPATSPTTIASYESPDGPLHDLAVWGGRIVAAAESAFVVVEVTGGETPAFVRLGAYPTIHRAGTADANTRHALVADGPDLLVIDVDPVSEGFLGAPLASWASPRDVRAVRLDRDSRAYVLTRGSYEIFDLGEFGGR